MSRILLFGCNGQVGWALARRLQRDFPLTALDSADADFTRPEELRAVVRAAQPQVIINAAAYTAVDQADDNAEAALAVNARAPAVLAEAARGAGALLVHYSTDYVFDGTKGSPYTEDDPPSPLGVYGRSKLEGDLAIQESGAAYLIFRTQWVYGLRGRNFLLTMQRLLRERREVRVVGDQFGAPTWCGAIAAASAAILSGAGDDAAATLGGHSGLYNMTCGGETSWYGFAAAIRDRMAAAGEPVARLESIASAEYPTRAARPAHAVLDNTRLAETFGIGLPDWLEALDTALAGAQD